MSLTNNEKDMLVKEQAATIRLLTDLTEAGSWVINFAPDGSLTSVQWGDGFRRLMGYRDQNDFRMNLISLCAAFTRKTGMHLLLKQLPAFSIKTS